MTKQEILDYLDNVLHPIVSPDNWNVYSELHDMIEELPSAEPVKHEECEYIITKGKSGYREECKCSACGDSFYWTQDRAIPREFNYCRNCGRKITRFIEKEIACRPSWCSLVELPPHHGRLIDADKLKRAMMASQIEHGIIGTTFGLSDAIRIINDAPSVIEAEE